MDRYFDLHRRTGPSLAGNEIFDIKPVILGGSPTDPENKTVLSRQDHIKAVVFWNKIVLEVRAKRS